MGEFCPSLPPSMINYRMAPNLPWSNIFVNFAMITKIFVTKFS